MFPDFSQAPAEGLRLIETLNAAGYRAYFVGGCVRDTLMNRRPKDWDICTSATPEEILRVFDGWHVIETGLQHGTVTVAVNHVPYEVTTFRVDGVYSDRRHPDSVRFVTDVREDLARRDFTVNAMAWNPSEGLIDAFGGQEDLRQEIIRAVGDPAARFGEDALRILRALRFASVCAFRIEEETSAAIHRMHPTLNAVAGERIRAEMARLLCGEAAGEILRSYPDVITGLFPELAPCVGFDQRTRWHRYTVWEHILRTVEAAPSVEAIRWAMLFHDCGKPAVFTVDADGTGHAYGHQEVSRDLAARAFARLRMDRETAELALFLIEKHDIPMSSDRALLLRQLNRFGEDRVRALIEVHRADEAGKGIIRPEDADAWASGITAALDALLAEQPCFTLTDLAVNGSDLIRAGLRPGKALGETLQALLERVMAGKVPNEKAALLMLLPDLPSFQNSSDVVE